ncbi:MAG: zf-TFIIB domain-containing protein [Proteobacteria bacterium]|nr:zf-TFIIB domain-containing protein [Pseudomonadota bacterium]
MSSPVATPSPMLVCPRCAELLDDLEHGVFLCERCEGLWIATPALAQLDDLAWTVGEGVWWRNEIACPACAADARGTIMTARMAAGVVVDECPEHGAWFDHGELARLIHSSGSDLDALRARLAIAAPTPEAVATRRARHRALAETRRAAAVTYHRAVADETEQRRSARVHEVEAEARRTNEAAAAAARAARDAATHQLHQLEAELEVYRARLAAAERLVAAHTLEIARARAALEG